MNWYWPSAIVRDKASKNVWLWQLNEAEMHLNKAIEAITFLKENYKDWDIISSWVDIYYESEKISTVYHKCYIDTLGYMW